MAECFDEQNIRCPRIVLVSMAGTWSEAARSTTAVPATTAYDSRARNIADDLGNTEKRYSSTRHYFERSSVGDRSGECIS